MENPEAIRERQSLEGPPRPSPIHDPWTRAGKERTVWLPLEGRYGLMTAAALVLIGLLKGINLLALLGCILLAVVALNFRTAGRRLKRLRGRRRIVEPVFAGRPCDVVVDLVNPERRKCLGLRVEDRGPDHLLTWFAGRIEGKSETTFRGSAVLPRRGRYAWGPLRVVGGYPFGLVLRQAVLVPGEEVIVLPVLGTLHRGKFLRHLRQVSLINERERRRPRRHPGAQAEFHSLRSFRTGDSPRAIHWRTSARRGELMVREYEDVPNDNLLLVFDPPADPFLEKAISLAATIAWEWCRRKGDRLVLATAGPRSEVINGITGPEHARRVLECLALQEAGPATNQSDLASRLKGLTLPSAPVVLIGSGTGRLVAELEQVLKRSVVYLDAARVSRFDFYDPPGKG
jgi:uncharacterized protein (DUF58 family)